MSLNGVMKFKRGMPFKLLLVVCTVLFVAFFYWWGIIHSGLGEDSEEFGIYCNFHGSGLSLNQKKALLNSLGKLATPLSQKYLLRIINECLKERHLCDTQILCAALDSLRYRAGKPGTQEIRSLLNKLTDCDAGTIRMIYGVNLGVLQQYVYAVRLCFELAGKSRKEKIAYLIEEMTDSSGGKKEHWLSPGVMTLEAIRNGAIEYLLISCRDDSPEAINKYLQDNEGRLDPAKKMPWKWLPV